MNLVLLMGISSTCRLLEIVWKYDIQCKAKKYDKMASCMVICSELSLETVLAMYVYYVDHIMNLWYGDVCATNLHTQTYVHVYTCTYVYIGIGKAV